MSATQVDQVLAGMIDVAGTALATGESVTIRGFGDLTVRDYKGGRRRHPGTGEVFEQPPYKAAHFKPSRQLNDRVNG